MLIKLIKNDMKSSYRELFPLFMGLLLFSIIAAVSVNQEREWLSIVTVLPFFALFIATAVILTLTIIKLFANRLYSREGYLTLTLPVSTFKTFLSKILTAMIWILLTSLVVMLALTLFVGIVSIINWSEIRNLSIQYKEIWSQINFEIIIPQILRFIGITFPQVIINIIYVCSLILFSVVITNTSFVSKNKLAVGIIVYLILNFIFNNVNTNLFNDWIIFTGNTSFEIIWSVYLLDFLYFGIISAGLISGAIWLNDHKLELE